MAFVNLPPNLQDIFKSITDRIAKLETGPNQAMYTAESAQSVATTAQIQAINAGVQANNAASQATIAQAQATIASTQATAAQASANGKNKNTYSTSAPGSTANIAGDLWFQYGTTSPYTNKVIAQFVGLGGTSWQSMPITGLVVTNIDAGSITTGTLSAIQIDAGSGSQKFNVSSTGYLSAQGAYIKGNITADSGTFTGSIRANDGYFGTGTGSTLTNGWSIGASGLTGVGTGTITGGTISGSTLNIGSGFSVTNAGVMTSIQGTIGGFTITNSRLFTSNMNLNGSTGALTAGDITASSYTSSGALSLTSGASLTTNSGVTSQFNGSIQYPGIATGSGSTMVIVATGSRVAYTTSSERFKQDIQYITSDGWLDKVEALQPITYKTSEDFVTKGEPNETQIGFLAEDIADLENEISMVVIKDPLNDPFSISYERLTPFLVLAIKELKEKNTQLEQRIIALESKL